MRALGAIFLWIASAAAQAPATTPPRVLWRVDATYSEEANKAKLEGAVSLRFVVNTSGLPGDVKVTSPPLGLGLDEAAADAVHRWRFAPCLTGGQPVACFAQAELNFELLSNRAGWYLSRAVFDTPEGALRPVLTRAEYPHDAPKERAHIALSFEINEHGEPKDLNVDKAADSKLEQAIIAAAKKWRFKPAMKDGAAIAVRATFDFVASPWSPRA